MALAKHPVLPSVIPVAGLREGNADSVCKCDDAQCVRKATKHGDLPSVRLVKGVSIGREGLATTSSRGASNDDP
jgi:hypothetical protein